jgi:uncharacterized protein involved in response to NO
LEAWRFGKADAIPRIWRLRFLRNGWRYDALFTEHERVAAQTGLQERQQAFDRRIAGTAIHAITAGAIGTMIWAVMTRTTLDDTGRTLSWPWPSPAPPNS